MERFFPNEILLNIFQHLSIHSQRQCLQVCRSWNAVARTFTTDTTIKRFATAVAADPAQGLAIRQMHFTMQAFTTDYRIAKDEFISFVNKCPRLAEISLNGWDPIYYSGYLFKHNVKLPQLEAIHLRGFGPQHMPSDNYYAKVLYKYCASINQMCINVSGLDINRFGLSSITDYLHQFSCLKYLSLASSCDILETLKITDTFISQQLYQYLKHCCAPLSHLVIILSSDPDFDSLISTFGAFEDVQALSISHISFENYCSKANSLLQNLGRWFPYLNQVDIKGFGLAPVQHCYQNLSLDFNQLNLLNVSIDLSAFFIYRRPPPTRIALELITNNATTWYERERSWLTRTQFVSKDDVQYINNISKERRIQSEDTAVISVKAANIQSICILYDTFDGHFDQLMQLAQ
ncbi:unnamed protein product [Mucor fragilis]